MSQLRSNPVFSQYRAAANEESSEEDEFVDLDAFEDITPSCNTLKPQKTSLPLSIKVGQKNATATAVKEGASSAERKESDADEGFPSTSVPAAVTAVEDTAQTSKSKYMETESVNDAQDSTHYKHNSNKKRRGRTGSADTTHSCFDVKGKTGEEMASPIESSGDDFSFRPRRIFRTPSLSHVDTVDEGGTMPISFWEALVLLYADEGFWRPYAPLVPPKKKKKNGFLAFFSCMSNDVAVKPKEWDLSQVKEPCIAQDLAFLNALLHIPFDYDNVVLHRILFTIYHTLVAPDTVSPWWQRKQDRLAAKKSPLATDVRSGEGSPMRSCRVAWDRVGFQGTDPVTDLRSTGLLGLLQLLYLIDQYPALNALLWQVCRGDHNGGDEEDRLLGEELPYALVGFNITSFVVSTVTRGVLKKEIERIRLGDNIVDSIASRMDSFPPVEDRSSSTFLAYCSLTLQEKQLIADHPVISIVCEFFIGCIHEFVRAWLSIAKEKNPEKLTVADFHDVRNLLFDKWKRKGKSLDVFRSAAVSRTLAPCLEEWDNELSAHYLDGSK